MTVSVSGSRVSNAGNGVTTAFSFPYTFMAESDLVVIERDDTTGVETLKTLTTHYTVTGEGVDGGGTVTMLTAPALGTTLTVYRDPALLQQVDLKEDEALPVESIEEAMDKLTLMVQSAIGNFDRAVKLSDGFPAGDFDTSLPELLTADAILVINEDGDGFTLGPDVNDIAGSVVDAEAAATAAAASAAAAAISEANAAASATAASGSASDASDEADDAADSATDAQTAQAAAEAAQAAAEAAQLAAESAANSTVWSTVVFLTTADSPRTILDADNGSLFVVDATAGDFIFNLDEIANLTLSPNWSVGFKKSDVSGNILTINRGGTDTIDGGTSKTLSVPSSGLTLVPDDSTSPDTWTSVTFGVGGGSAAPEIEGSVGTPVSVAAAAGILFSGVSYFNKKFLDSDGGAIVVSANPQIEAGISVGQQLILQFTSDTDTVELNDGNGLDLAAKFISENKRKLCLEWTGAVWSENWRR